MRRDAALMLAYRDLQRAFHLALTADWRGALVALVAALALAIGGRVLRLPALGFAASALGIAAGWAWMTHPFAWPAGLADRLPEVALLALAVAYLEQARSLQRIRVPLILAFALISGWWLAGAPRSMAGLVQAWVSIAIPTGLIAASALLMSEPDAWGLAAASLALAAALHAVSAPAIWALLALVPAAATLGALAAPGRERPPLPAAAGIGAVAGGAVAMAVLMRHARIGPIGLAALAPLLAAWWSVRLARRFRLLGRAAPAAAAILSLVGVVLLAYSAAALAGLR
jgi:hypothetical protein